jgi:protein-S-isoprenylcysteine O-methyltransferase Ste14
MPLQEELRAQGNWLFKYRSYLPTAMLVLVAPALWELRTGRWAFRTEPWWAACCLVFAAAGLFVRSHAVGHAAPGTSGRNTRAQKAHSVNTTGMYSVVRHPLYLGNYLIFAGLLLFVGVWWFAVLGSLAYWIYYERIMYAEEEFLRQSYGEQYVEWASKTPAFLPRLGQWRAATEPFSMLKVMRNENTTLLGIVASFALMDTAARCAAAQGWAYNRGWAIAFGAGLVVHLAVRVLNKTLRD